MVAGLAEGKVPSVTSSNCTRIRPPAPPKPAAPICKSPLGNTATPVPARVYGKSPEPLDSRISSSLNAVSSPMSSPSTRIMSWPRSYRPSRSAPVAVTTRARSDPHVPQLSSHLMRQPNLLKCCLMLASCVQPSPKSFAEITSSELAFTSTTATAPFCTNTSECLGAPTAILYTPSTSCDDIDAPKFMSLSTVDSNPGVDEENRSPPTTVPLPRTCKMRNSPKPDAGAPTAMVPPSTGFHVGDSRLTSWPHRGSPPPTDPPGRLGSDRRRRHSSFASLQSVTLTSATPPWVLSVPPVSTSPVPLVPHPLSIATLEPIWAEARPVWPCMNGSSTASRTAPVASR